jgi:hypothetical protein
MAANRNAYIIGTIREAFAEVPMFTVTKVFRDSFTDQRAVVYPFISSSGVTDYMEDFSTWSGKTMVTVYVNAKVEQDPSGTTGKATAVWDDITDRIENAIWEINTPRWETHGNGQETTLRNIVVVAQGGFLDDGKQQIKVEYSIEVTWDFTRD